MVLPLVDEDKPKCYICHAGFDDVSHLREHRKIEHPESSESNEKSPSHEPAPGDVTLF